MTPKDVIRIRDELKSQRSFFEGHWDDLAAIYTPFSRINQSSPDLTAMDRIFDTTPRRAAYTLANGLCSLIVPRNEQWFEYSPPESLKDDDQAKKHYRTWSEIALAELDSSNFYEEIWQAFFESPVFGTGSLFCGELDDDRRELHFLNQPIGTYYIAEDAKGRVNLHLRELSYTANQAAEEFGKDSLPNRIAKLVDGPQGMTERFTFIQLSCKRNDKPDSDAPANETYPWWDIVVAEEGKHMVRQTTTHEFPFAVHRWAKHQRCVYGFGPGCTAVGDGRQLSFLNELADAATEKEAFPPVLASAGLEGEVAMGAAEVTYKKEATDTVDAVHAPANLRILEVRLAEKREAVNDAFYVPLFQLFTNLSKERSQMTATEANYLNLEKLTQFSPIYGRIMSEMIDVVLSRVFGVLMRAGKFGEVPPDIAAASQKSAGSIKYRNRIALAMQAKENTSLMELFGILTPVMQVFPQLGPMIFSAYKPVEMIRDTIRNSGQPERWIATKDEMQASIAEMQAAASERAKLENAELASRSAANTAKLPPGAVDQALQARAQ